MPHIVVEYSANLTGKLDIRALLAEMHAALATEDSIDLARIKSRAIPLSDFIVGDKAQAAAMIHIVLKLMPRSAEITKPMAQNLQAIAQKHAAPVAGYCAITAEVVTLNPETYCK